MVEQYICYFPCVCFSLLIAVFGHCRRILALNIARCLFFPFFFILLDDPNFNIIYIPDSSYPYKKPI